MESSSHEPRLLRTTAGDAELQEYRLRHEEREWVVLHTAAVLSRPEEIEYLRSNRLPYGLALWPAAVALAHDVAGRAGAFAGRSVLELGAGTGLPGIVAASLGAEVVQTDRQALALDLCRRNARRNHVPTIEHRLADWSAWSDRTRYDWILGADVLYAEAMHDAFRRILESNLAPGGRVLLADPFRGASLRLLEQLEQDGWRVGVTRWSVGEETAPRAIGIFELTAAERPD